MGGRIIVESVAGCSWNGWPDDRGIRKRGAGVTKVSFVYACTFEKQNDVFLGFDEAGDSLYQEVEYVVRVVEVVSHDRSRNPELTMGSARSRLQSIMTLANYKVNPPFRSAEAKAP
ncbi:hypothetical protein [Pseudomonas syringae]|nr:hypothetical protein [Pseudomonas syringae]AQL36273.1 hypothetical protein JN853_07255 [Pseudomonas syringae pv. actinidiae ICMP 9853]EPM81147.1 hypothetical protein A260_29311 [Pseudomonas syringae pv. actinidiae ICMP 19068]EPM92723.1 hypothetical protein A258_27310 [Pseudomonas syringae pv. actinidiae ICMP 19104]EPM99864.1 hypothetical protein A253_27177 [Pseudomonas syringae pv. actinidiae ICMP 19102]EPN07833.1 hypothetical protein A252_25269 [Pseudomonas syringae pv. actinidiae ICMP 985